MKHRQVIEEQWGKLKDDYRIGAGADHSAERQAILLEVMLDIRDLLAASRAGDFPKGGVQCPKQTG